jgi:uncharacterized protein (DUF2267 family)
MKEHEIIAAVQQTAGTDTPQHTQAAVRATLSVLGQRLRGGETSDLASQLPPGLAEALPHTGPGERFGLDEFYQRVAAREGNDCTPQDARRHARATFAALRAGLTPGEYDDLVAQLPDEYGELVGTEPVQHH